MKKLEGQPFRSLGEQDCSKEWPYLTEVQGVLFHPYRRAKYPAPEGGMYFPFGVQHSRDGGRTWKPVPNRRTLLGFLRCMRAVVSGCVAWPIETLSDFREENGCLRVDYFEPVSYIALVDLVYTARYRLETERWDIEYRKLARDAPFPRWIEPDSPWDEWRGPCPPPQSGPFT